jgi:hypothetical protein
MLPNPAQVTTLVPGQNTQAVQPIDPNTNLLSVLQTLLQQNPPATNINQATPDQQAAAKQQAKTKEAGANVGAQVKENAEEPMAKLPAILSLLGVDVGDTSGTKVSDTGEPAGGSKKKKSGLDSLGKVGKAISTISTLAALL